jgi:hypothetical protein
MFKALYCIIALYRFIFAWNKREIYEASTASKQSWYNPSRNSQLRSSSQGGLIKG